MTRNALETTNEANSHLFPSSSTQLGILFPVICVLKERLEEDDYEEEEDGKNGGVKFKRMGVRGSK